MKRKLHKLPDNDIPEEIQIKAGMLARSLMRMPPKPRKESNHPVGKSKSPAVNKRSD